MDPHPSKQGAAEQVTPVPAAAISQHRLGSPSSLPKLKQRLEQRRAREAAAGIVGDIGPGTPPQLQSPGGRSSSSPLSTAFAGSDEAGVRGRAPSGVASPSTAASVARSIATADSSPLQQRQQQQFNGTGAPVGAQQALAGDAVPAARRRHSLSDPLSHGQLNLSTCGPQSIAAAQTQAGGHSIASAGASLQQQHSQARSAGTLLPLHPAAGTGLFPAAAATSLPPLGPQPQPTAGQQQQPFPSSAAGVPDWSVPFGPIPSARHRAGSVSAGAALPSGAGGGVAGGGIDRSVSQHQQSLGAPGDSLVSSVMDGLGSGSAPIAGYVQNNVSRREEFRGTTIAGPLPPGPAPGAEGGEGGAPALSTLMPTTAPGSPFDIALQSQAGVGGAAKPPPAGALSRFASRLPRPHKPRVLKRIEQGDLEFRRRQAAKALGKIIGKEHVQYQLSYAMMLGIYTSVVGAVSQQQRQQHSHHGVAGAGVSVGAGGGGGLGASRKPPTPVLLRHPGAATPSGSPVPAAAGAPSLSASLPRASPLPSAGAPLPVGLDTGTKLSLDDFMAVRKLVFPPGGSQLTPPHPLSSAFKFKDYAPRAFHALRERFGIDQGEYLRSLGGAYEYVEFNSNSKSGSFFFYSHDGR